MALRHRPRTTDHRRNAKAGKQAALGAKGDFDRAIGPGQSLDEIHHARF